MESGGVPVIGTRQAVIVAADLLTPYGRGIDAFWQGISSGRTAISRVDRFSTKAFTSSVAGIVPGLSYHQGETLAMQMLRRLFEGASGTIPKDAKLFLATTKGEIDLLEQAVLAKQGDPAACGLDELAKKAADHAGVADRGLVISAACASGSAAISRAAAAIRGGHASCVLVTAVDAVTEFVYAGFSSLMALDAIPARPFDRGRKGLSLGEAAAYALVMSEERAKQEGRPILGRIEGWGLSDDANHMTGPSRTGEGLARAITKALASAGADKGSIACISAHGTGTLYNDAMELQAFRTVFDGRAVPLYSVKGGIGHTLGAAGLIEVIIALRSLAERIAPPTVGLSEPDRDAEGWASPSRQSLAKGRFALVTNAGFSGINAAVVVSAGVSA